MRQVIRWTLVVVAVGAVAFAAVDWSWVNSQRRCPLGLEFERSGAEVLYARDIPPKVTCRYDYMEGDRALHPPQTVTYDALPVLAGAGALVAIAGSVFAVTRP